MDGVSAAASITALVEATAKLAEYLEAVKNAAKEARELKSELAVFYSLLTHLCDLESRVQTSTISALENWRSAVRTLRAEKGPLAEYSRVLATLTEKLATRNSLTLRITWISVKKAIQKLLEKMRGLMLAITIILNLDQTKILEANRESIRELQATYQRDLDHTKLREALTWISTTNPRSQQAYNKSLIAGKTGVWLLETTEFKAWLGMQNKVLYCPGIPGAGKTLIAAAVIDHLEARIGYPAQVENLAYIFCDYKVQEEQSETRLICSLVQQLVQNDPTLAEPLITLYDNHIERKTFPTTDEVSEVFKAVTMNQKSVYIVIDALDELSSSGPKRRNFLNRILQFQRENNAIRLFCTSRPEPEVNHILFSASKVEIKPTSEDVGQYVTSRLEDFKAPMDVKLSAQVVDWVVKESNGMFLLARFLVDQFQSSHSLKQIKQAMKEDLGSTTSRTTHPHDVLKAVYQKTVEKIHLQSEADTKLAMKVLRWLTHAKRLLTVLEMRCALAIEPGHTELDEDDACSEELILVVCAGLVTIDPGTGIIRLVHQTAQEYFDGLAIDSEQSAHLEIATTCLTYLCFDRFKHKEPERPSSSESDSEPFKMMPSWRVHYRTGRVSSCGLISEGSKRYSTDEVLGVQLPGAGSNDEQEEGLSMLDYAANYWFVHARYCQGQVSSCALRLLRNQRLATNAFNHATSLYKPWPFLQVEVNGLSKTTGLHLVAAVGLMDICEMMLRTIDDSAITSRVKADIKAKITPTMGAGIKKDIRTKRDWMNPVLDSLYEEGSKKIHADVGDDGKRSPLMWAAHGGHDDVVKLLLSRDDVDSSRTCHRGDLPLHYATRQGWASTVSILLPQGGHLERNAFGETAIVQAALQGHGNVIEIFEAISPKSLASLDTEVTFGLWPVHLAAQRHPVFVMKSLVEQYKVNADVLDPKGYSPLTVAADWANLEVVRYFLREWDWRSDHRRNQVFKAMATAAANRKRLSILQLLVEEAGDVVSSRDGYGKSLLDIAVDAQNSEATLYLGRLGLNTVTKDTDHSDIDSSAPSVPEPVNSTLLDYIRRNMLEPDDRLGTPFSVNFDPSRINRILIYSGCFNPPHVGHLAFLEHSFKNGGADVVPTCAFINPQSDEFLTTKYGKTEDALLLPRAFRANLWQGDSRVPSWLAVLAEGIGSTREPFLELQNFAAGLGYTIEFTFLLDAVQIVQDKLSSLYQSRPLGNLLVNTFGRWNFPRCLDWPPMKTNGWREMDSRPDVKLYQYLDSPSKNYLRLIEITPHVSMMSSTMVRRLCSQMDSRDLDHCDMLPEMVLSWDLLKSNAHFTKWRTGKLLEQLSLGPDSQEEHLEPERQKAWDFEKALYEKEVVEIRRQWEKEKRVLHETITAYQLNSKRD